jgi:hypothetical protein
MPKKRRSTHSLIVATVAVVAVISYVAIQAYNMVGSLGEESNLTEISDVTEEIETNFSNGTIAAYLNQLGCAKSADCVAVQVSCCDNNEVGQKSCVNLDAVNVMIKALNANCSGTFCPAFLIQADWYCSCDGGMCNTTWSASGGNISYVGIYK